MSRRQAQARGKLPQAHALWFAEWTPGAVERASEEALVALEDGAKQAVARIVAMALPAVYQVAISFLESQDTDLVMPYLMGENVDPLCVELRVDIGADPGLRFRWNVADAVALSSLDEVRSLTLVDALRVMADQLERRFSEDRQP